MKQQALEAHNRFHPWKLFVAALLAVVVVFHVWALWSVQGRHYELTSKDYYQKEIGFEHEMKAEKRAKQFKWLVNLDAKSGLIHLNLQDLAGQPGLATGGVAELYRPNNSGQDRSQALVLDQKGQMNAQFEPLAEGAWNLKLRLETPQGSLLHKLRIQVP